MCTCEGQKLQMTITKATLQQPWFEMCVFHVRLPSYLVYVTLMVRSVQHSCINRNILPFRFQTSYFQTSCQLFVIHTAPNPTTCIAKPLQNLSKSYLLIGFQTIVGDNLHLCSIKPCMFVDSYTCFKWYTWTYHYSTYEACSLSKPNIVYLPLPSTSSSTRDFASCIFIMKIQSALR